MHYLEIGPVVMLEDSLLGDNKQSKADEGEGEGESKYAYIRACISSGRTDHSHEWMAQDSLENFAEAAAKGVPFIDSHRYRTQGFGVSTSGELEEKTNKVFADFKLIRGWALNDAAYPTSDIFIDAIKEGVISKVSVGYAGSRHVCQICKSDLWRGSCYHWPGRTYTIVEDGKEKQVVCEVEIQGARLIEVSAVKSGANPDAVIVEKAEKQLREGTLPYDIRLELEQQYGMKWSCLESPVNGRLQANIPVQVQGGNMSTDMEKQVASLKAEVKSLTDRVAELEPLAESGEQALKFVKGEALEAYKAMRGAAATEADTERFQKRLDGMSYEEIRIEADYIKSLTPKTEVPVGSQTRQPDSTRRTVTTTRNEKTETPILNPPWSQGVSRRDF